MFDHEDGSCECGGHAVERHNQKTGDRFYGCSNYPKCVNTSPLDRGLPMGHDLMSGADYLREWANAFYDGDGK